MAAVPLASFLILNAVAWVLWNRREQADPFRSFMLILALMSIVFPLNFLAFSQWGDQEALDRMGWPPQLFWHIVLCLLVPAGMVQFYLQERSARRKKR